MYVDSKILSVLFLTVFSTNLHLLRHIMCYQTTGLIFTFDLSKPWGQNIS